ncbi:MAG: alpha/beta hydrolase [Xanthomonadaceae bacterium]|nr:alpha/beta hydrolase [Xanthomonadaceae bacterium]
MIFRPPGSRKNKSAEVLTQNGFAQSFDGTRIFYSKEGEGRPLVFVYGLVCSSLHWTYQIEHFKNGYQAVWSDYRGHHHSEMPKDISTLTIETMATDLLAVLEHENIKDAIFLGHSMGVNVVLELYRQQPERVRGLVLANGTPRSPLEHIFRNNLSLAGYDWLKRIHALSPDMMKKLWKLQKNNPLTRLLIQLGGFNPHLTPKADIDLYVDQVMEMDPALFIQVIGQYQKHDCTSWLHTVNVPTLILAGEEDHITPIEQQKLLHQLIPNSQFVSIKHGSHCPQMDLPDLFNMSVQKFLDEQQYYSLMPRETTHSDQGNLQSTQRDPSTPFS